MSICTLEASRLDNHVKKWTGLYHVDPQVPESDTDPEAKGLMYDSSILSCTGNATCLFVRALINDCKTD